MDIKKQLFNFTQKNQKFAVKTTIFPCIKLQQLNNLIKNTAFIKKTARQLGFEFCGIAKARKLDADAIRLDQWLQKGLHGAMQYMEKYFDLRIDPEKLVPGAKSVIT
jgi:epoxyqueuosine reductase